MSSGFISEAEILENRKLRQEEWDRVRTADQPLEAPEVAHETRSLFERLQEQKNKRDIEFEEAHKLKNMIKGLDDDEVEFLDLVDKQKLEEERKKNIEEQKEMQDFKAAVASLQEKSLDERLKLELKNPSSNSKTTSPGSGKKSSQMKFLKGAIVKKSTSSSQVAESSETGVKRKHSNEEESSDGSKSAEDSKKSKNDAEDETKVGSCLPGTTLEYPTSMKCIGILPGMGSYDDSSDTDCSSCSDQDDRRGA